MRMTVDTIAKADAELSAQVVIEIDVMIRRKRMRSQAELARAIGKTSMWLSDRMTGRVRLTVDDLALIAMGLGVGIVDLLPRDRRQATNEYPEDDVMPGVHALPTHPIHGAVSLPRQIRRTTPPVTESPRRVVLTAPQPLSLPL